MEKKWTILIMPNTIDAGYSITVRAQSLRILAFALCMLAAASIALCASLVRGWRQGYVSQLKVLERKIDARDAKLARLGREFGTMLVLEDKLRAIAGLKPRQNIGSRAGMGGQEHPESPYPGDMVPIAENSTPYPPPPPDNETMSTNIFLEAIAAARDSFSEILNTFEKEQDRLSRIPSINPVYSPDAWISSGYGYRKDPINGARRFHDGIDIVAPRKTPVIAPANGVITFAGWREGIGRMVEIKHGYGYRTTYGHNEKLTVKKGDTVKRGDTIALLGSSGRSTGPHVHYEIRQDGKLLNPYRYVIE